MTKASENLLNPLTGKNFQIISIDKLKPSENNARKHPLAQMDKLKNSIRQFGFVTAIIVDANLKVLGGHARLEAAEQLGLKHVPIIKVEHLTEAEKRAFMLADNRLTELAEWDEDILEIELAYLVQAELDCEIDFDVAITGFETAQIDNLLSSCPEDDGIAVVEDLIAGAADKPAVSKSGDLWLLGKHKILCGDALVKENYKLLIGKECARVLCSDVPYNLPIDGFVSGKGSIKHKEFAQASGEMSFEEFRTFLYNFLLNSQTALVEGGLAYIFIDWRHTRELQAAASKNALTQLNLCVWDKGTGGMGSFYRSQHELIFVYRNGKVSHTNNIMLGKHGRNRGNVWYHPSANMSREGRKALKGHPTPKPVPLLMDILKDCTKTGDIALDPFLGSGSLILAAEKTKRRCYGIEIDPFYVDLSIRRWQELTGEEAIHAGTGLTFIQEERNSTVPKIRKIRERSYGGKHVN
jgi:DNA modification methylase